MASDRDAIEELRTVSNMDAAHWVRHYLYFPVELAAKNVAAVLRERGFVVEDRLGADGVNWLVLAKSQMVPTEAGLSALRTFFEDITASNGGEYDGWEAEVQGKKNPSLCRTSEF